MLLMVLIAIVIIVVKHVINGTNSYSNNNST